MQEFINSVTERLGIDKDTAKSAVGSLLSVIRGEGGSEGQELVDRLPGGNEMAEREGSPDDGGGLMGTIGGALGGLGGGAAGLAGLVSSGLSGDKLKQFVEMFVGWAKKVAGDDLVEKVIAKVPALKSIL